jgi:hypothetical protein
MDAARAGVIMRVFVPVLLLVSALGARAGTVDTADLMGGQLFVHGSGFGTFKAPVVTLGGVQLVVVNYSPTDVVATVPGVNPGTYSLHVRNYTTQSKSSDDTMDVTLGAQGLQGDPGPKGDAGPKGDTGPKGDQGPPGPATPDARFGTNTTMATGGATGRTCTIGEIILTAGPVAVGVPAIGQYYNRNQESVLFQLIGTTYGDDPNNAGFLFRLPDLRSAAPNGMTYTICTRGIFPALP